MKKQNKLVKPVLNNVTLALFKRADELCELDLCDRAIESEARILLTTLRNHNYVFDFHGIQEEDCLVCLYMSLISASTLGKELQKHSRVKQNRTQSAVSVH
jgi:hypothetical protein